MKKAKDIKCKLVAHSLTSAWLLAQLCGRGIETDKFRLCKILSGTLKSDHANTVLAACEKIIEDYENKFADV